MPVPSAAVSDVDNVGNIHPGLCKRNDSSTENAQTTSAETPPSSYLAESISSLNDMLRTAEEKVNLAKATYDSVSHVHQIKRPFLLTRSLLLLAVG